MQAWRCLRCGQYSIKPQPVQARKQIQTQPSRQSPDLNPAEVALIRVQTKIWTKIEWEPDTAICCGPRYGTHIQWCLQDNAQTNNFFLWCQCFRQVLLGLLQQKNDRYPQDFWKSRLIWIFQYFLIKRKVMDQSRKVMQSTEVGLGCPSFPI